MSKQKSWRLIYGSDSKRLKDQELLLRFLAFYFQDVKYERPMSEFLSKFMKCHRQLVVRTPDEFVDVFTKTIDLVAQAIGPSAFRPVRALNAAVFDSVMVAVAKRIMAGPISDSTSVQKQYEKLLDDETYKEAITRSTSNEDRVGTRMRVANEYLSQAK